MAKTPNLGRTIAEVVPEGDLRASLEAIRDRLAFETDDTLWAKHKRECNCQCGMGDGRLLVALTKRLSEVLGEIEALSEPEGGSRLDGIHAGVADELAKVRTRRAGGVAGAEGAVGAPVREEPRRRGS